jgi:hypothetical protein
LIYTADQEGTLIVPQENYVNVIVIRLLVQDNDNI